MNRRKRPFWLLLISLLSLVGLVYLVLAFPPNFQFTLPLGALAKWGIFNFQFSILPIFFLLIFTCLLSLITYLLRSSRRAALIGLLIMIYLILRMFRLDSPYFLLLLLALFISLELFFKKRI
ncbi:MAG: hypothetical protein A3H17_03590 [Candidatus Levybacteria bacterium RIFCSPLOWO2_12_FULL_37_14]|nr:MAG: hypothetical protein US43_C0022G0008 [Candidatus Levybacteria bacterium GW2011_GWA1_37_16]KKQ40761.1 MAG: hypothetical protein US59_C0048G0008 [Candidatus Levybacteria bacterium GW2011_GWB1_37_8]OGH49824.1 MAG: hypothetical protein A3H17_03590 [Candidatus Levybacteria bacterium RIFCSPLOWO2_12_FULL_37_14]